LAHAEEGSVLSLVAIDSFLKLEVVGRDAAVSGARVDMVRFVEVWDQGDDIFLLIYRKEVKMCNFTYH
jgi:hypothetical protein